MNALAFALDWQAPRLRVVVGATNESAPEPAEGAENETGPFVAKHKAKDENITKHEPLSPNIDPVSDEKSSSETAVLDEARVSDASSPQPKSSCDPTADHILNCLLEHTPRSRIAILLEVLANIHLTMGETEDERDLDWLGRSLAGFALIRIMQGPDGDALDRLERAKRVLCDPDDVDLVEANRYAFYQSIRTAMEVPKGNKVLIGGALTRLRFCVQRPLRNRLHVEELPEEFDEVAAHIAIHWTGRGKCQSVNALANLFGLGFKEPMGPRASKPHPFKNWLKVYEKNLRKRSG